MPQAWLCAARQPLRLALPWAGLLAFSGSLGWAMTVGLTGGARGGSELESSQPLRSSGGAPESDIDTFADDYEWSARRRFQNSHKVLTITVDGPNGSFHVYCDTTTVRTPLATIHMTPDAVMAALHQLCSPAPSSS